ncbi:MAG: hypothetical protein AB1547_13580 [Thermodesulfobacteriota bacterium]
MFFIPAARSRRLFSKNNKITNPSVTIVEKAKIQELEKAAKRDGEAEIPGLHDNNLSYYEHQIQQEAKHWLHNTGETLRFEDAKIYPRFIEARKDFCDARDQYENKRKDLKRQPQCLFNPVFYWSVVIFLSSCEVFINFQAFEELFSAEATITALTASIALALMQLFSSHMIGGAFKQKKGLGWAFLLITIMVFLTAGLAYLRAAHIGAESDAAARGASLFLRPKLNIDMITAFFFGFNMLFLSIASWMAAQMHDPDESYEQMYKTFKKYRKKLIRIKEMRDRNLEEYRRIAWDMVGLYRSLITKYRDLNMQHRPNKATPDVWLSNIPEDIIPFDDNNFELNDNNSRLEDSCDSTERQEIKAEQ